ncbi:hypothetical protein PQR53_36855 [Paraburkholderia fungorum]|uniref:hypothetical protein n=1 Tax=Paraburkholderia fungorum TaxID=134537 RepID=UPI0038BAD2FD
MSGRGFITISMHELERVKIIEAVVQHPLVNADISRVLGTTRRVSVDQQTFGFPMLDIVTMVEWSQAGMRPRHF